MAQRLFVVSAVDLQASITPVGDGDREVLRKLEPGTSGWRRPARPESAQPAGVWYCIPS